MKKYINHSWQIIKQNKLYSFVSILLTAVTITYLMVLWMGYMFHNSDMAPEDKRERTTTLELVVEFPKNTEQKFSGRTLGALEVKMVEQIIAPLESAEFIRVYDRKKTVKFKLPNKERIKLQQAITDENVWKQFSYKFIEGRPFTKEEFESGLNVAVISRSTAKKLFHSTENIVGREITPEFPQKTYRVVGVVEDFSALFGAAFAQIWIPFPKNQYICHVDIIRKRGVSKKELEVELIENFTKYSQSHAEKNYGYSGDHGGNKEIQRLFFILSIILLIVPAVNGMGLVASNISERTSEIGVRKAYGAGRKSLVRQLIYENMLSTGIGATIGFICSMLLVTSFGEFILTTQIEGSRELYVIPFSTLFDIRVFALAVLFCFIINIMSVYIPAMRATRTSIADAVKGGES